MLTWIWSAFDWFYFLIWSFNCSKSEKCSFTVSWSDQHVGPMSISGYCDFCGANDTCLYPSSDWIGWYVNTFDMCLEMLPAFCPLVRWLMLLLILWVFIIVLNAGVQIGFVSSFFNYIIRATHVDFQNFVGDSLSECFDY